MSDSSLLLGSAALVIWGAIQDRRVDETALNHWRTNEHFPKRLSVRGFLRARRYYAVEDATAFSTAHAIPRAGLITHYLTFYEVVDTATLDSSAYMEKLRNPTDGTEKHLPVVGAMNRSVCNVVWSRTRQEMQRCLSGVGGALQMYVGRLAPEEIGAWQQELALTFDKVAASSITLLAMHVLVEDRDATDPGSRAQSFCEQLTSGKPKEENRAIVLLEFSGPVRSSFGMNNLNQLEAQLGLERFISSGSNSVFNLLCTLRP